jgi:hypothetical protein
MLRPEGTADMRCFSRPCGTYSRGRPDPRLKPWAIFTCPSGTEECRLENLRTGRLESLPYMAKSLYTREVGLLAQGGLIHFLAEL